MKINTQILILSLTPDMDTSLTPDIIIKYTPIKSKQYNDK